MAITATLVTGAFGQSQDTFGSRTSKDYDLVFSGNYATGGEAYAASTFGFANAVTSVIPHGGVAIASDAATGNAIAVNYATSKFVFFESGAEGAALAEKTNAEAYPTGSKVRVTVTGY